MCYATNLGWKLLATATIGGGTTRLWALYSSAGESMQALNGRSSHSSAPAATTTAARGRSRAGPSRRARSTALAARIGKVVKAGVFASADPVRLDANDALIEPTTLHDTAVVEVRHHLVRPSSGRMEQRG